MMVVLSARYMYKIYLYTAPGDGHRFAKTCSLFYDFCSVHCEIVIELCNVNQQNVNFPNECFNSILRVFYMFRTSYVRDQEDHLCKQFLWYGFQTEFTIKGCTKC